MATDTARAGASAGLARHRIARAMITRSARAAILRYPPDPAAAPAVAIGGGRLASTPRDEENTWPVCPASPEFDDR
jgi:hypothetical protein